MSAELEDRFAGSLLGLALGDALARRTRRDRRSGGLEALLGGVFPPRSPRGTASGNGTLLRWTDDMEMAMVLAESELGKFDHPRAPAGIDGRLLIARATAMALAGDLDLDVLRERQRTAEFRDLLSAAREDLDREGVRRRLGAGVEAHRSTVTAVYFANRFTEFTPMLEAIVSLGGDTDTIGAQVSCINTAGRHLWRARRRRAARRSARVSRRTRLDRRDRPEPVFRGDGPLNDRPGLAEPATPIPAARSAEAQRISAQTSNPEGFHVKYLWNMSITLSNPNQEREIRDLAEARKEPPEKVLSDLVGQALAREKNHGDSIGSKGETEQQSAWNEFVAKMTEWSKNLPAGHHLDDSRESIYGDPRE